MFNFSRRVFLICPVREATWEQMAEMSEYIAKLEQLGWKVYYPARDTDQDDPIGLRICMNNAKAIMRAKEVHIFYDSKSQGSLFDLGVAFALKKKLVIANPDGVVPTSGKSFANMLIAWSKLKR